MTDKRLTDLTALPIPDATDLMHVVDVSDTTDSAEGTSKQATIDAIVLAGGGLLANEIFINLESDFAVQDATTITLEANKVYVLGADITTAKRFIMQTPVSIIKGTSLYTPILTYTGTDAMFTAVDVDIEVRSLVLNSPNALQTFNFFDTAASKNLNLRGVTVQSTLKFATVTGYGLINFRNVSVLSATDGLSLAGNGSVIDIGNTLIAGTSASFIAIDLGSATFTVTRLAVMALSSSVSGGVGISGLLNSGNIPVLSEGIINTIQFSGLITPLQNIVPGDLRWEILNAPPVSNSSKAADIFLTSTETVTINSIGVFVAVNGVNWISELIERFTTSISGILTYVSPISSKSQVTATATVSKVGGGADEIQLAIAVNGSVQTKTIVGTENASPTSVASVGIFTLNDGDTIQVFVANSNSTSNVIVDRCNMAAINGF